MNKIVTGAVMMATVFLLSCGGNDTPEVDKSIMPPADSAKATAAPADGSTPAITANPAAQPASLQASPGVTTAVPSAQMQQSAQTISADQAAKAMPAAGLNPAHGQPGHRCDIAVGAPLNSAPTAATKPQIQPTATPAVTAAPVPSGPVDPNAKLNPPHGQPGHDCSIAVGAPLKKG